MTRERAITFPLDGATLVGVVHEPETPAKAGVLIIVGGPQYRIGAHRQFVHLARRLAENGIAAMRFDYRGLGDSEGPFKGFEEISDDIDAGVAAFREALPGIESITLWGLCDAASAIVMKADHEPCVRGAVLLNPWVRTTEGEAKAYLRYYYLRRLLSADFWKKFLSGKVKATDSVRGLRDNVATARRSSGDPLPKRVVDGMSSMPFPGLLILSGNDLTAREFEDAARELLAKPPASLEVSRLPAADHTFSKTAWKDEVAELTVRFVQKKG